MEDETKPMPTKELTFAVNRLLEREVQQIKGEAKKIVTEISDEAEKIREKIQNPMRTIGGAVGGQLDRKIGSALGLEEQ